jgi:hypothetical protein
MCIICIDYNKQKMTVQEAYRALDEMREGMSKEHVLEVVDMLWNDHWEEWLENMPQTD